MGPRRHLPDVLKGSLPVLPHDDEGTGLRIGCFLAVRAPPKTATGLGGSVATRASRGVHLGPGRSRRRPPRPSSRLLWPWSVGGWPHPRTGPWGVGLQPGTTSCIEFKLNEGRGADSCILERSPVPEVLLPDRRWLPPAHGRRTQDDQWQEPVPESVNVFPASGVNRHV